MRFASGSGPADSDSPYDSALKRDGQPLYKLLAAGIESSAPRGKSRLFDLQVQGFTATA